jgi:hypothetical protein
MNNLSKAKYFRILSIILAGSIFLPVLFSNLFPYFRTRHVYAFIWFLSLILLMPRILQTRPMLSVFLYGAIIVLLLPSTLWMEVDDWNKNALRMEFYDIALAISVIIYYRLENDYIGLAKLVKWTMIFIFITAIMTIYTASINPMYVRDIIGVDLNKRGAEEILSYKKFGGGNYGYAAGVICLFPMLIYYFKNIEKSYWKKIYLMLFAIVIFYALIRIQIFANILIASVIIILSLLGRRNVIKSRVYIGSLILILIFIPLQFYADLLKHIGGWFQVGSENYLKFNDMARFIEIGGGYEGTGAGGRAARFPLLWKSFMANPVFGHFLSDLKHVNITPGGHLHWMNKLAVFGLVGFVPFFLIIYYNIKNNYKLFDKEFGFYFLLSIFSVIALGSMKAIAGAETWFVFFVITPGMYYIPLIKANKKRKVLYKEQLELPQNG